MNSSVVEVTPQLIDRSQMTKQRLLRAYLLDMKYEFLRTLRNPGFGIPFIILPVALFLIFGSMQPDTPATTEDMKMNLFSGMAIFGIMGPALFGFGAYLAAERQLRTLEFKRALPMPPGSHLIAKMACAMMYALIVILSVIAVAVLGGNVTLTLSQGVLIGIILLLGVLPFAAIGFYIGSRASAAAASGITTLIYLPQIYLSGLFYPLPKVIALVALIMPPFYLKQLVLHAGGSAHTYVGGPVVHVVVLLAVTVLFTVLAAKRFARTG